MMSSYMGKTMKTMFLLLIAVFLTGCAAPSGSTRLQQAKDQFQISIPTCDGKDDCEFKWAAALKWVQSNCAHRVQIYNESFIQTYKSGDSSSVGASCEIVKEPLGNGKYRIVPNIYINNVFMGSAELRYAQQFNDIVGAASVPYQAPPDGEPSTIP